MRPEGKVVLDDVDKRIIEQLQQDGRRPYTQIAPAVGLSEAAVRQRVQRLIDSGVMQIVGGHRPQDDRVRPPGHDRAHGRRRHPQGRRRRGGVGRGRLRGAHGRVRSTCWSRWWSRTTSTSSTCSTTRSAPSTACGTPRRSCTSASTRRPTPGARREPRSRPAPGRRPTPSVDALHPPRGATQDHEIPIFTRGSGTRLFDIHGRSYLDGLASLFVVQVGHGRAELAEAGRRQAAGARLLPDLVGGPPRRHRAGDTPGRARSGRPQPCLLHHRRLRGGRVGVEAGPRLLQGHRAAASAPR